MGADHTPEAVPQRTPAAARIAEAMGRPLSPPPTEEERRAFWEEADRVDEEVARRYGPPEAA